MKKQLHFLSLGLLVIGLTSCSSPGVVLRADLDKKVRELSALAQSSENTYFAISDHGNSPALYEIDLKNEVVTRKEISNATNEDWEALIIDDTHENLYILDTGNNREPRKTLEVYKIAIHSLNRIPLEPTQKITLHLNNLKEDFEAGFIANQKLFLVSKNFWNETKIFSVALDSKSNSPRELTPLGTLPGIHGVTDALLFNQNRLLLLTYFGLYECENWNDPTQRTIKKIKTLLLGQTESLARMDSENVLVGTESGKIYQVPLK